MYNIVACSGINLTPWKISATCNKFRLIIPKVGILIWDFVVTKVLVSQDTFSYRPVCENNKLI